MQADILAYNARQAPTQQGACARLADEIARHLPEAEGKLWHGHPVWFLDGNPTVGYSVQKPGVRLMFWSGADFEEPRLDVLGAKFKDASIFYGQASDVDAGELQRWLGKAREIQWDYKHIVKRKGRLERLT